MNREEKLRRRRELGRYKNSAHKEPKKNESSEPPQHFLRSQSWTVPPQSIELAIRHLNDGNFLQSEKVCQGILKSDPNNSSAWHLLGLIQFQTGKHDVSIEYIKKALELNPNYVEALSNLGLVYKDLGRFYESIKSFKSAIKINAKFIDVHINLGNVLQTIGEIDESIASYQSAIKLDKDHAEAHYNLGVAFKHKGQLDSSVASFQKAVTIKPDHVEAYKNLGIVFQDTGRLDEAILCMEKAITIKPDFHSAQHILNSLLGNTVDSAPKEYVEEVFNSYADDFEDSLVNDLGYTMPILLRKVISDLGLINGKFKNVIDLGCGTGLVGERFRDIAEKLVGVDVSKNMILKAKKKNIYDELYTDDIINRLASLETKFDLIISADVFVYIGNLLPLFQAVKKYSNHDSLFMFSTEHSDGQDFILRNTCRYAHSKEYILSVSKDVGFKLEFFAQSNLRKEKNSWVPGGAYVLSRI
jgi:predicted TPR repeat methyltransferase